MDDITIFLDVKKLLIGPKQVFSPQLKIIINFHPKIMSQNIISKDNWSAVLLLVKISSYRRTIVLQCFRMNLNDLGYSVGGQNKHNRENVLVQPQLRCT